MRLNHRGHRGSPANAVKHLVALCVSLCPLWLIVFLFAAPIGQHTNASALQLQEGLEMPVQERDRKSTRLNSSHANISYAVFCLKKKKKIERAATNVE